MRRFTNPSGALAVVACIACFAGSPVAGNPPPPAAPLPASIPSSDYSAFPLLQNVGTNALFPMPPCNGFHLEEATIDQMQAAMKQGNLTSVQLSLCYLERMLQTKDYLK